MIKKDYRTTVLFSRKVREGKYMILNENENGNEDKKIFGDENV